MSLAQYGPDDKTVTKVVAGLMPAGAKKVNALKRWVGQNITQSPKFREELIDFIKSHGVHRIIFTAGVIGCIHEEGKDYPVGQECPFCPFWHGRDRWADARPVFMTLGQLRDNPPW